MSGVSGAGRTTSRPRRPGAELIGGGRCRFSAWAPRHDELQLGILDPTPRLLRLEPVGGGWHELVVDGVEAGTRYSYMLPGRGARPDPASRSAPEGVHGPSAVVDPSFDWTDRDWTGRPLREFVFYELHVGTFTHEGTLDAAARHLDALVDLGITAIELMPLSPFPGTRNWGYDGVQPWAVHEAYGGLVGLQRFVDACHARRLCVVLDVVYNHLGPEGNHLGDFGPYFTDAYRTPWGAALNFDGPDSDEVRRYFIESALWWATDCHVDGFRLDAIHGIRDHSARPFLAELAGDVAERAARLGRPLHVIAESDLNDARVVIPRAEGGIGLDGAWSDDFHHALHALLTGERSGYYEDFGSVENLARAYEAGFVFSGDYSTFRRRRHGSDASGLPPERLVVFAQNHDQIGNRPHGERLLRLTSLDHQKLAAAAVVLSPYLPLLFMGEEFGAQAPFQYFTSHSDPGLVEAVRRGRREEFAAFAWTGEPPDPQDEETFRRCRIDHSRAGLEPHRSIRAFYRELLRLRRDVPALAQLSREATSATAHAERQLVLLRRRHPGGDVVVALHFGEADISVALEPCRGAWRKIVDTADERWAGTGSEAASLVDAATGWGVRVRPVSAVAWLRETGGTLAGGAEHRS